MALEPGRRSASPESSGRDSPKPRQWRNQFGAEDALRKDKSYRKYASGVDRALSLFETALEEWADYISFLNRLLKALQARHPTIKTIPVKATVAKRLSQCLNPSLPSGVHQKALEVYAYVFSVIGKDGLSRDLPLYLPGLASVLSFASLSVRSPFLDLLERYFLDLDARALRPAMKAIILALLPGLEDESSEDFERTMGLVDRFKVAMRPRSSEDINTLHSTGDDFFWQCFFLASITGQSRRSGALAYLVRHLPRLGHPITQESVKSASSQNGTESGPAARLAELVTSPEPGLLLRCFAAGLADEQLLIQRGYLDLLVTHLPLHSRVLQTRVQPGDLELLMRAAVGVVTRREMSLNRRLWTWLLGPEPSNVEPDSGMESPKRTLSSRTGYFEEFGLHVLTSALLSMIKSCSQDNTSDRARPYRICLSLMDRWEIGGLVVPELFLPIVDNVRKYQDKANNKADFAEVLRSASVFFDGVESGLIYGEMLSLIAHAIGPGTLSASGRQDKLALVQFIVSHFNVREEEMVLVHAPLTALSILSMLEDMKEKDAPTSSGPSLSSRALRITADLLELVPDRAFVTNSSSWSGGESKTDVPISNTELLKRIQAFYIGEQGSLDATAPPLTPTMVSELLLQKSCSLSCDALQRGKNEGESSLKSQILVLLLTKVSRDTPIDITRLLSALQSCFEVHTPLSFTTFTSIINLSTQIYLSGRCTLPELLEVVPPIVNQAWSFLSASEPKYHVETVRALWQLQTVLGVHNRDIEAAISALMIQDDTNGTYALRPAEPGRTFGVIWTHTLQDTGSERRSSKVSNGELKPPRLYGVDHYELVLTRPLFLMLDALLDERTQLFIIVKSWLTNMVGSDKMFLLFITKFLELSFLATKPTASTGATGGASVLLTQDDDLDLGLYYVRTLSNVLSSGSNALWASIARRSISAEANPVVANLTGMSGEVTFQTFFLQVCMRCIGCNVSSEDPELKRRMTQMHRCALTVLHQILLNPYAAPLSSRHLEGGLIDTLFQSLSGPDPYAQVLLLDVVFASLKLQELVPAEPPLSPNAEKRTVATESAKGLGFLNSVEQATSVLPPPPLLLKCLQEGLSSANSRPVLDSWVSFMAECLPFYSDSIFQVLIPLVETLCAQVAITFKGLQKMFRKPELSAKSPSGPETTLISLMNALEQVLAKAHDQLLGEEARAQVLKSPDQPQGFFGNIFSSDAPQSRSATANDRLTVLLAFQDAVRICFTIWSWGQGSDADSQDSSSAASFTYTSLRMRNRARRLLEHLFAAETLQCLETVIEIWRTSIDHPDSSVSQEVFHLLPALDGSRPKHTIPAIFNSIYSRTNPNALDPSRKSTMTVSLQDTDIVVFLVDYARSLEDDAMDEIWQDCLTFLRDLLGNPFPHRQTLPSLLEFAAILGEKVDNTNFGEQRKMRRELGDLFLRLLTALFTTRPINFADTSEKPKGSELPQDSKTSQSSIERAEDVVGILSSIVPNLPKILVEPDRVLSAATSISVNVIGPTLRAKGFPDTFSKSTILLLQELSRLPNNQKTWKKDITEAFNDTRFFSFNTALVKNDWLPLLRQWTVSDKERMTEILGRLAAPTTAGIVFGVGATSARLEADRKTQLNLRRVATLVLASGEDTFVTDLPTILEKLVELLAATSTSSPSSTTRADVFMAMRALVLKTSSIHLAPLWPIVNYELQAALASVAAPDQSSSAETYNGPALLQACKLLDLLTCIAPDDFQLHEWLFVTDTIDAIYRSPAYQPVALVDEISEELGSVMTGSTQPAESAASLTASRSQKRPLLGPGGIASDVSLERKEELIAKVLRPFFGQLSIFAFESTYAMGALDWNGLEQELLRDLFDDRTIVKAL